MSIAETLPSLAESLRTAADSVPSWDVVQPLEDGISLFDAKNEIFLSYLQSLALRNLDLIRDVREIVAGRKEPLAQGAASEIQEQVVDNLIRQRVYLEKGVRPLEERLKYTIEKALRAAVEEVQKTETNKAAKSKKSTQSGSESDSGDSDDGSESEEGEAEELSYMPRPSVSRKEDKTVASKARTTADSDNTGVYRPPRVTATSMPENFDRASKRREAPNRSRTLDEYVSNEMADAPTAQPSIGSTIAQGGRRQISARERAKEAERTEYEETHLMRLPKESKKEQDKRGGRDGGFGGEDWRGLGDGLDRIDTLTRGVKRGSKEGALERSRKRRATEDGQRQDGRQEPGLFDRRKKRVMQKLR